MQFDLDQPYLEVQQQTRELGGRIDSMAAAADESSEVHAGVLAALRASGLARMMVDQSSWTRSPSAWRAKR
jgi:hypothetical protein